MLGLGVLNAALLGLAVLAATADPGHVLMRPPAAATAVPPASVDPLSGPMLPASAPAATLKETLERPLFRADRRPPRPDATPPAAAHRPRAAPDPELREDIRLIGVIAIGARRRALLRVGDEEPGRWLEEGASLDGWRLARLEGGSVTLEAGRRQLVLQLRTTDRPAPPAGSPTGRK